VTQYTEQLPPAGAWRAREGRRAPHAAALPRQARTREDCAVDDAPDPMDGFDLTALRGMLDRFEDALHDARLASREVEGLEEPPLPDEPPSPA
jgi:hypothetical protein